MSLVRIYAIRNRETDEFVYVGSTRQSIDERFSGRLPSSHKNRAKTSNTDFYTYVSNNGGIDNFEPVLLMEEEITEDDRYDLEYSIMSEYIRQGHPIKSLVGGQHSPEAYETNRRNHDGLLAFSTDIAIQMRKWNHLFEGCDYVVHGTHRGNGGLPEYLDKLGYDLDQKMLKRFISQTSTEKDQEKYPELQALIAEARERFLSLTREEKVEILHNSKNRLFRTEVPRINSPHYYFGHQIKPIRVKADDRSKLVNVLNLLGYKYIKREHLLICIKQEESNRSKVDSVHPFLYDLISTSLAEYQNLTYDDKIKLHTQKNVVLLSGGFDCTHEGHVRMIRYASLIGDVVILLNSDAWLTKKKGKPFMTYDAREAVLGNMKGVIDVVSFPDDEHGSACKGIEIAFDKYKDTYDQVIFANGGDRRVDSTPSHEQLLCEQLGITVQFGVGGTDKPNSSSWVLKDWVEFSNSREVTERPWGNYKVLLDHEVTKVKLLQIDPGQSISLQYHHHRTEQWYCVGGTGEIILGNETRVFSKGSSVFIDKEINHKLSNHSGEPLLVIEVQLGSYFGEDDIVRLEDQYNRIG